MKIDDLIDKTYNWDTIKSIPEFAILKECQQSTKWHSEGNAFIHTKLVCEMAEIIVDGIDFSYYKDIKDLRKIFLASALFHDIGKGVTTSIGKDGKWHSYGHEIKSEIITRKLLWDEEISTREAVCSLVRWHMEPFKIFEHKNVIEHVIKLSKLVPSLDLLIKLKMCDSNGSKPEDIMASKIDNAKLNTLADIARECNCLYFPSKIQKPYFNINPFYQNKIVVNLLIGLPGSGKSYYSEKLLKKSNNGIIVSRDIERINLGLCKEGEKITSSKENELKVTELFNKKLFEAAKAGKEIIIDNINLKREYRDSFKNLLKDFYVEWNYFYIETDLKNNFERRKGQIKEEVIENMINNLEWPTPDEYDSLICERN